MMGESNRYMQIILLPCLWLASFVYGGCVRIRNLAFNIGFFRVYCSRHPVLSVGNFVVGGTGKTPFTRYVCQSLLDRGMRPVILSRGYGGRCRGPVCVNSTDAPEAVGDEPLMHQLYFGGKVPVVISKWRVDGAKFIEQKALGDCIVLDDGFQHRWLGRRVDIVLVSAASCAGSAWFDAYELGKREHLLPLGTLREPVDSAMSRADILVGVFRRSVAPENLGAFREVRQDGCIIPGIAGGVNERLPISNDFLIRPARFRRVSSGAIEPISYLLGRRVSAFCAIANPESFFEMLIGLGLDVAHRRSYADHHIFTQQDMLSLCSTGCPLICTEKDFVKIRNSANITDEVYFLEIEGVSHDSLIDAIISRLTQCP